MKSRLSKNLSLFSTGREHIIKAQTRKVYDKHEQNRNITNNISMERTVENVTYPQYEMEMNGYRVSIEFPDQSEQDNIIHKEVRQLLTALLHEQMEHGL